MSSKQLWKKQGLRRSVVFLVAWVASYEVLIELAFCSAEEPAEISDTSANLLGLG